MGAVTGFARLVTVVVGVAGALAGILSFWIALDDNAPADINHALGLSSEALRYTTVFLLTIFFGAVGYQTWRRRKQRSLFFRGLNSVWPDVDELFADLGASTDKNDINDPAVKDTVQRILNLIGTLFDTYTDNRCAVCIKWIESHDGKETLVRTYVRDSLSQVTRAATDQVSSTKEYSLTANTAFVDIIGSTTPNPTFRSNNLTLRALRNKYINGNNHWREFYNATLVVPIDLGERPSTATTQGFLCVDNFAGNFDAQICSSVLHIFAKMFGARFIIFVH